MEVGHCTIIQGEESLVVGKGPIRTGVTAIFPSAKSLEEVYAGLTIPIKYILLKTSSNPIIEETLKKEI